ncbi:DUF2589 domain-containing protein [Amantichitinum ursilacus]|uniref:DUF2589 domain-containing protein n=1 Tax=Amantichitinum ursilacus TaxID=857265 RepID=A0A0N0GN85_9NEIS|nr:DUF2589 domain-containing protein [Amantichitinum ursilacus]KPC52584.1 hypothetical protein WG78_12090 [Amantichitinum ursilacus]
MATPLTLKDLLAALSGAVIGAQDQIEQHQLANLSGYFDEDNRPRSVQVRLPSMTPGADEGEEDFYRAPLLALVPANPLQIREVEIEFDVELGELGNEPQTGNAAAPTSAGTGDTAWNDGTPRKTVQIDAQPGKKQSVGKVHLKVVVHSTEISAGMAKLTNQLAQTQGVVKAAAPRPVA